MSIFKEGCFGILVLLLFCVSAERASAATRESTSSAMTPSRSLAESEDVTASWWTNSENFMSRVLIKPMAQIASGSPCSSITSSATPAFDVDRLDTAFDTAEVAAALPWS